MKKVGFLVFEGTTHQFLEEMAQKLHPILKDSGWELILLEHKIEGIPKEKLIKLLEGLK